MHTTSPVHPRLLLAGLLLLAVGCSTVERQYHRWNPDVSYHIKDQAGVLNKKRISISSVLLRNLSFSSSAAANFADNLGFHLGRRAYTVARHSPPPKKVTDEVTGTVSFQDVLVDDAAAIQAVCAAQSTDLFVNGYIYEATTGTLLDEEKSVGIMLYVYDRSGKQVAEMRYIGFESLDAYDQSARIARAMSGAFEELTTPQSSNWYFF